MDPEKHKVLLVDDEPIIRRVLKQRLTADGYQCEEAGNAEQAVAKLEDYEAELVVLDVKMPGKSGAELLPEIKKKYPDTAVMMATAITDTETAIKCMRDGAYDYLVKPFNLDEVSISAQRALEKRKLILENRAYQQHLEDMVLKRTEELKQALDKVKDASLDTIHRLSQAAEYRDEDTGAHIERIGYYSAMLARQMGMSEQEVENILYAAPMHDVGKIGIPDNILLKPGKLDKDEWEIMKQHSAIGAEILNGSDADFIKLAEIIALTHHEKWDGSGYPGGLKGEDIPIEGRIVAIVDVFDAITSKRPYKEEMPVEEAFRIIREGKGKHFDPAVVDAFFALEDEILATKKKYKDNNKCENK